MRHYRLTLREVRKTNSYDQQMMLDAIYKPMTQGGKLHFATEAEYLKWKAENGK